MGRVIDKIGQPSDWAGAVMKKPPKRKTQNRGKYTATPVACEWAGTVFEVSRAFGQEP